MSAIMREEIESQPRLLAALLPQLRKAVAALDLPAGRVLAGGCGDSAFAADAATGLFLEGDIDYVPATAHDLAYHQPIRPSDLVILMSISGGTRRTVQAAHRARASGATTLAVTCNADSALAVACNYCLQLPYQPLSRSTPHTADYSVTLLALAVAAEILTGSADPELDSLPDILSATIATADARCREIVSSPLPPAKTFVLGQGSNLATAHYIAAKFHEAGGLTALAGETENFVHGMNFMVELDDAVYVIGDDGPGAHRAAELVAGLPQLCRTVVAIGAVELVAGGIAIVDSLLVRPALSVFPAAVAGQLLCLRGVEQHGLAVERPRAGRAGAEVHAQVQRHWMTRTDVGYR